MNLQLLRSLALATAIVCVAPGASAAPQPPPQRAAPWSKSVIELAESLPVQDGGRVKPLHTYASFLLLRLNGRRSVTTPLGQKLEPVEWLLDLLFFPEMAGSYPVFLVQDVQATEAIGLSVGDKRKRDRYSFDELQPGLDRLFELARQYGAIEEKDRSTLQQQVYLLAGNVDEYARLMTHLDYGRRSLTVGTSPGLSKIFGGQEQATFSGVLAKMSELRALQEEIGNDPKRSDERRAVSGLLQTTAELTSGTESLPLMPPAEEANGDQAAWSTPSDVLQQAYLGSAVAPLHLEMLSGFEALCRERDQPEAFLRDLGAVAAASKTQANARGEYAKVGLELTYYKAKLLDRSLVFFILAFVLTAVLWLRTKTRFLYLATAATVVLATALLVGAIVMRCIIRDRPPVSTLYETVLFVTAVGGVVALFMEVVNRQRIALSAAAVLGVIGLFIANGYETLDKRDTMPALVAVLDTNFWLATHVTAITVGYSAGMLAALLASVFLITRIFGIKKAEPDFAKSLSRMVYGVLCFGLIFSVVGTILGGIWANESWGRFWGWDPKENGALLIVLTQIVILHGRMGGYLRDFGVAMAAAFGGTVIAFSWWGVNLLGVGLHSYGFTSGIHTALWSYYIAQWGLMGGAGVHYLLQRARSDAVRSALAKRERTPIPKGTAAEPAS